MGDMERVGLSEQMNILQELFTVDHSEIEKLSVILKKLTNFTRHSLQRHEMTKSYWKLLLNVADLGKAMLQKDFLLTEELEFLTNILRCLRNICAGCCSDDKLIISSKDVLDVPLCILILLVEREHVCGGKSEDETTPLQTCLQLLGNIVCQSVTAKAIVWKEFIERTFFSLLLSNPDFKVQESVMMILYHCLTPIHKTNLLCTREGHDALISLTNALCNNIIDWGILILECIVYQQEFLEICYNILPTRNKLLVLDVIAELFENTANDLHEAPEWILKIIKSMFIENVTDVLKSINSDSDELRPTEISRQLSVLCIASVDDRCSHILKTYQDLLEVSVETLKYVHLLGKQSFNDFSAIRSLQKVSDNSREDLESNPTFGFKKNLIRLIGNMCAECSENQDLVRKLDGIPLILDCCNLDIRNPYIMQWCILAIHSVLKNNSDNQAIVAGLTITDELATSSLLHELGLMVELENGRYVLKLQSS